MDVTITDVGPALVDPFREYARVHGPEHDESYTLSEELVRFDPAAEPAVLSFAANGAIVGAGSVMVDGFSTEGAARFRILHAADPRAYPLMLERLLPQLPDGIARAFVFLPENAGGIEDVLAGAGFGVSRRATILVHESPGHVAVPPAPDGVVLSPAGPEVAELAANLINTVFHGQPGHYDMSAERAAEILGRRRIVSEGTLVAWRDGALAGLVITAEDPDELAYAEIETLGVMPDEQGRGIGKALLCSAVAAAARMNHTHVTLSTGEDNRRALGLYLKVGFRVEEVRVCWELSLGR